MKAKILIADDEGSILRALEKFFIHRGDEVFLCHHYDAALALLQQMRFDLALVDLKFGEHDGIELIKHIQKSSPETASIVMTGFGTIDSAIEAVKAGAFHYLNKPFKLADLSNLVDKAILHQRSKTENQLLRKQVRSKYSIENVVGISEEMGVVYELINKVADTDSTILILGGSGTGKELVAKAIHYNSPRSVKPLVTINCGAIPEELLEAELFGHVRGAFTGAVASRSGRFEMADGGTIFLDEIGEMSPKLQVKLLRVLQERNFEPVGSTQRIEINVRIIAATNKDLEKAVKEGHFREDLYYRLNVIPIKIPLLKERSSDIPLLIEHFLKKFACENHCEAPSLTENCLKILMNYSWPGNVRELENVIERLVILRSGQVLDVDALPERLVKEGDVERIQTQVHIPDHGISFKNVVSSFENDLILKALEKTEGNKNKAASLLRLNRTTLVEKIKKRQLEKTIFS